MTNYKSASQLGITAEEHQALILTMDVLRAEQIVFNMTTQCSVRTDDDGKRTTETAPCRTSACIGGTMKLLMLNGMKLPDLVTPEMGDKVVEYVNKISNSLHPLYDLFWGYLDQSTPPEHGITAIERFLQGDTEDPWGFLRA